jgi:hypothetical protein
MRSRHRPGRGLVLGLCGLGALLLSFFGLPWISEGGEDLTFKDLREIFNPDEQAIADGGEATPSDDATVPGLDPQLSPSTTYLDLPTVTVPGNIPPIPPETPEVIQAAMPSDNRLEDLEQYTDWSWLLVIYLATTSVIFSTWIVPTDRSGRVLTGFLTSACLGLVNLLDKDGSSAPRVLCTLSALWAAGIQLQAFWYLYWDVENSPDPAYGALLGLAGALAVVVACIMGTRREFVPQQAW